MTGQPSSPSSGRPRRLHGDMYSRAEERYRAEIAAETSQPAPPSPPPPAPEPVHVEPLVVPIAAAVPPPLDFAQGSPVAAVADRPLDCGQSEPVPAPAPPVARRTPTPRRLRRPPKVAIAAFGAMATAAALGIAVTLSPAEETPTPAVHAATPIPTQPFDSAQGRPFGSAQGGPFDVAQAKPTAAEAPATVEPVAVPVATPVAPPVSPPVVQAARVETAVATSGRPLASEGRLRITSTPSGARVTVNGIGWGQTPLTVDHLPLGAKTIRLTRDGYAAQQRSVVVSGEEPAQSVHAALRRR